MDIFRDHTPTHGDRLVRLLAGRQLDDALHVFAVLESAAAVDAVIPEYGWLLRTAASELLDDAAELVDLAESPRWPPSDSSAVGDLVMTAVSAVAGYAEGLGCIAAVLALCGRPEAKVFARLANAAVARLELLAA
jgi:hypothetical protein